MSSRGSDSDKKGSVVLEDLLFGISLVMGLFKKDRPPRAHIPAASLEELYPEEVFAELPPPAPKLRRTEFHVSPGWGKPKPESLPAPTYAPAGMALAVVFIAFGLISKWYIVGVGLAIAIISMWHWIGDLVDD